MGKIIWEGKSRFDGKPIVCIATENSKNRKTGDMVQTWILRSDINPIVANQTGEDKSVCGICVHRGIPHGDKNSQRSCYVNLPFGGPNTIYKCYKEGKYDKLKDWDWFVGKFVRLGSYGEIVNVPFNIVAKIVKKSKGHTGYSHAFKKSWAQPYRKFLMASVDSEAEIGLARMLGWRYFRVRPNGLVLDGEIQCPASKEMGHKLTCEKCKACNGSGNNPNRVSVTILAHGSPPTLSNARKNLVTLSTSKLINVFKTVRYSERGQFR